MTRAQRGWAGTPGGWVWGAGAATAAGAVAAALLRRRAVQRSRRIVRGVTVDRPPEKVRELLRDQGLLSAAVGHPVQVTVQPAPADWGTEIYVEVDRAHDEAARTVLRRAKSLIECGQVVSAHGDPADRGPLAEAITDAVRDRLAAGGRP